MPTRHSAPRAPRTCSSLGSTFRTDASRSPPRPCGGEQPGSARCGQRRGCEAGEVARGGRRIAPGGPGPRGAEGGRRERDERGVGLNRAPTMTAVFVVRRGERGLVLRVPTSLLRCCPPGHCERSIYPLINRIHRGEPSSPAPGGRPSRARACVCVCVRSRSREACRSARWHHYRVSARRLPAAAAARAYQSLDRRRLPRGKPRRRAATAAAQ